MPTVLSPCLKGEICTRYDDLSTTLEKNGGELGWEDGLRLLEQVSQKGTTWSVIYSLTSQDIYFSVYQTWEKVYHLHSF